MMDTNTILLIVGGIILGVAAGFIVAKMMENSNASKLVRIAKSSASSIINKESQISNELAQAKKQMQSLEDKTKDCDFKLEYLDKKKEELDKAVAPHLEFRRSRNNS